MSTAAVCFPLCISSTFILLWPVNAAAAADVQQERASVDVKDVNCCLFPLCRLTLMYKEPADEFKFYTCICLLFWYTVLLITRGVIWALLIHRIVILQLIKSTYQHKDWYEYYSHLWNLQVSTHSDQRVYLLFKQKNKRHGLKKKSKKVCKYMYIYLYLPKRFNTHI